MRFAVISDVHANLEALEAVLKDIRKRRVEGILFLGDAVGYGPNPNECLQMLSDNCRILLAGNHDRAAAGLTDIEYFNEYAKKAVLWTRQVLTEKSRKLRKPSCPTKTEKRECAPRSFFSERARSMALPRHAVGRRGQLPILRRADMHPRPQSSPFCDREAAVRRDDHI